MSISGSSTTASGMRVPRAYRPTTALAKDVTFGNDMLQVWLTDGRIISAPLAWFPALNAASNEQRANYEISGGGIGIHWPDIDEDLSVAGLMAGVDWQSA